MTTEKPKLPSSIWLILFGLVVVGILWLLAGQGAGTRSADIPQSVASDLSSRPDVAGAAALAA